MSAARHLRINSHQRGRRGASVRSESATGFLWVPARRLVRQVCGLVAAPPMTEAAAHSRSPRLAGRSDGPSAAPSSRGYRARMRFHNRRTR
jgi:hypothetical protein